MSNNHLKSLLIQKGTLVESSNCFMNSKMTTVDFYTLNMNYPSAYYLNVNSLCLLSLLLQAIITSGEMA